MRNNLQDIEEDTDEAFIKRHDLVKLLVEKIAVGEKDGRAKVDITYRFGPPAQEISVDSERSSEVSRRQEHRGRLA